MAAADHVDGTFAKATAVYDKGTPYNASIGYSDNNVVATIQP